MENNFKMAFKAISEARPAILAGFNGTGKSHFINKYLKRYTQAKPKNEAIVFNKDNTFGSYEHIIDRYAQLGGGCREFEKWRESAIESIKNGLFMLFPHIGINEYEAKNTRTCPIRKHGETIYMAASYHAAFLLATANLGITVFINKPERELHPRAQTELAKMICVASMNGAKVIVETQSDHFIYGVRIFAKESKLEGIKPLILWFDKTAHGNEMSEIHFDKDGTLSEYPDGLIDQFERNASELL